MSSLNTWLRPTCWSAIVTSSWKVSLRRKIICSVSSMTVPHDSVVFPRGKPHSPALWENILVLVYKNVVVWNCLANFIVIGGHFSGMGGIPQKFLFQPGGGHAHHMCSLNFWFFLFSRAGILSAHLASYWCRHSVVGGELGYTLQIFALPPVPTHVVVCSRY